MKLDRHQLKEKSKKNKMKQREKSALRSLQKRKAKDHDEKAGRWKEIHTREVKRDVKNGGNMRQLEQKYNIKKNKFVTAIEILKQRLIVNSELPIIKNNELPIIKKTTISIIIRNDFTKNSKVKSGEQEESKKFWNEIWSHLDWVRKSSATWIKGESQTGCFKKTKHAKFSEKRTFLTPCAYQGVKNVPFPENLASFVLLKHPFWDSPFCLITDEMTMGFDKTKKLIWNQCRTIPNWKAQ